MEFTVSVTLRTVAALSRDQLFDVAAIGGAASGEPGSRELETTLTVAAKDRAEAGPLAVERISAICPGKPVKVDALTTEEFDRRHGL